ncbi:MAG: TonB-dependent receptor plug domain-containing protein, partial [Ignavibacteriae bacterium]|nr:TonB-dependent receptor plug domain-containing protein [Ignavibacteriota bacterium]
MERFQRNLCFLITLAIILISVSTSSFAQTGKIAGRVTDGATGEALPFVNIIVQETTMGAASDIDGYYAILNLRPGKYNVKVSAIGFQSKVIENINISIDLTTKIDVQLFEASIELGEEVVVVATKPLVTKDLTSSTAIIGADEIANLPVTEFAEVLALKAGIVGNNGGINVRGGRGGEVVYLIDGVPITDSYDGSTVVDVAASSIQELQFVSGAFNAEYGKALSGVINLSTKEGNNEYHGSVTSYIGDYYSPNDDVFTGVDDFDPTAIRNIEGSFSGPIINNKLYFYGNARYIYFDGWLKGKEVYKPWDITRFDEDAAVQEQYTFEQSGSGEIVPMNFSERVYLQGKLTYHLLSNMKLNYNYINDRTRYQDYDHFYKLNPSGRPEQFRWGHTNILALTHTLGSTTFYQLNGSYFFKKYTKSVYDSVEDERWVHNRLSSQQPQNGFSFSTGGQDNSFFKRVTNSIGVKFDITSQVSRVHQVKGGFEFNKHN